MIYILNTDGSVHRMIEYEDVVIAEIEDPEQIEILRKAGTMFYVNARHRYIDSQRRVLTLPFNDGKYELNVSTQKDTVYDENTILKYNPEKDRFEVYSDTGEDFIDYSKPFRGATTPSVEIKVDGPRVSAQVRVSKEERNILRTSSDGLFIPTGNYVTKETFDKWSSDVFDIKTTCDEILDRVTKELEEMEKLVTPEYIQATILALLDEKFGDIETAIENYDIYVSQLDNLENRVVNYAANTIVSNRNEIINKIDAYQTLRDLDDECSTYANEVNYYEKEKEWDNPSMSYTTKKILISTALAAFIDDMEE